MTDAYAAILRKTDPFVLSETVESLQSIASNPTYPLPLGATPATGESDEDRAFLHTPFNKVKKTYKSPWKKQSSADADIADFQQTANEVWDAYRQLYYGSEAVGSVFVRRKGGDAKPKKGGALEALFGIQKQCFGEDGTDEIARWDSVHTVTIEVPNFDEGTCEYKIKSAVWCRYKPEDVGDVPMDERPTRPNNKSSPPKKAKSKLLSIKRLNVFDKAANNWDRSNHNKAGDAGDSSKDPLAPIPAVVTSSAIYTKDTIKVCKLQVSKKQTTEIPVASHIQNIGTLLEKIEADLRSKLERVDAPKCVEVLQGMYRPSLSPGLKLPNSSSSKASGSMISKLGGHATGMGVGAGLIGEIALKAKAKGLGNEAAATTSKAMDSILANEKKKLKDLEDGASKAPSTWNQTGLKKSQISPSAKQPPMSPAFLNRKLKKASSAPTNEPPPSAPTPEFMNFRSKLKSTAAK